MSTDTLVSGYLMEHDTEGSRIRHKTNLTAARSQLVMVGLQAGMSCLDVGCASGSVTVEMAKVAAPSSATGVDFSDQRLDEARLLAAESGVTNVEFRKGNAYDLPFANDTFDFVWARFVMEYLKDRVAAIREMKRVTKPGGKVICADLDGNCLFHYPIEPRLEAGLEKVMTLLAKTGFDPWVGRKLFHFFRVVGFSQITAHMMPHHLIAGIPSDVERRNWHEKVDTICEKLQDSIFDSEEMVSLAEGFKRLIDSPETFTYSPLILIVGTK
jgi:ubiquinone/menaquinone biosynthesis C-methylase UbiE